MRSRNPQKLAAVVLTAAMLCNTTVTAWATTTSNTVTPSAQDTAAIKTALTSGLEAMGQKPDLPRLLPSDTKVKAVGKITEKDIPLYFDPTEESNVYILLPLDAIVSVMEDLDDWFRISYNDCTGFISPEYVELMKRSESFETYGVVDAEEMPLLKEANGDSEVLTTLKDGDRVEVTGFDNGWFAIKSGDNTGYVTGDDLDLTLEKEAPKPKVTAAKKTQTAAAENGYGLFICITQTALLRAAATPWSAAAPAAISSPLPCSIWGHLTLTAAPAPAALTAPASPCMCSPISASVWLTAQRPS